MVREYRDPQGKLIGYSTSPQERFKGMGIFKVILAIFLIIGIAKEVFHLF